MKPTKPQLQEIAKCIIDNGLSEEQIIEYLDGWFDEVDEHIEHSMPDEVRNRLYTS